MNGYVRSRAETFPAPSARPFPHVTRPAAAGNTAGFWAAVKVGHAETRLQPDLQGSWPAASCCPDSTHLRQILGSAAAEQGGAQSDFYF